MVGLLTFKPKFATLAGAAGILAALTGPASAAGAYRPASAYVVVPIAFVAFLLLTWLLSRVVHTDAAGDAALRDESGDKPLTPFPDGDGHHHFH